MNAQQMQQMHQGQLPGPINPINQSYSQPNAQQPAGQNGRVDGLPSPSAPMQHAEPADSLSANASSLDDLVSGAAKDADKSTSAPEVKIEQPNATPGHEEKKVKKEKDKSMKLVYSDNETSPEEKMALLPRYAFAPSR